MKKLGLIAATALLGTQVFIAEASQIQINVAPYLPAGTLPSGNYVTDPFGSLVFELFNPISIYSDTDGSGDINDGDAVTDRSDGWVNIAGFNNPALNNFQNAGFDTYWGMDVEWELSGVAVLIGADYLGEFDTGEVNFRLYQYDALGNVVAGSETLALTLSVYDSNICVPSQGCLEIEVNLQVDYALGGIFYDQFGRDFATVIGNNEVIWALGTDNIRDLDNVPTQAGCAGVAGTTAIDYCRTTELENVNIAFSVPEPASLAILGAGLLGMGFSARRRRNKAA